MISRRSKALAALLLSSLLASAAAEACTQDDADRIVAVNKRMSKLRKANLCALEPVNSARAACWAAAPLQDGDAQALAALFDDYRGLARCNPDALNFNLGDAMQAFGQFCAAADAFSKVEAAGKRRRLFQVWADTELQCARDLWRRDVDSDAAAKVHSALARIFAKADSSGSPIDKGRLLATWRDAFAIGASSVDATSIATVIHGDPALWESWTQFLEQVRQYRRYSSERYYPDRSDARATARQYVRLVGLLA